MSTTRASTVKTVVADNRRLSHRDNRAAECMRLYFTSHPVHVGRHVVGVLRGPESEICVLVVTVALVVFGRHRHQDFVVLRNVCYNLAVAAADRGTLAPLSI